MFAGRAINGIMIGEVVGLFDPEAIDARAGQAGKLAAQVSHQLRRNIGIDGFIVVASVIIAPETCPMVVRDCLHTFLAHRQNVEPEQNGPQTIFFAHMVGAGAGAFLAADRHLAAVEKIAEEFPAGRGFIHADTEFFRHAVGGGARRHGTGNALDTAFIARRQMGICGQHGKRI